MNLIPFRHIHRMLGLILVGMATGTLAGQAPLAPTAMVEVPIATAAAGVPASTFTIATAGASCPSSTPGFVVTNDGCPANQTTLYYPYSAAIDSSNDIVIANYTTGLTMVYEGGSAAASLIQAAKVGETFTPMIGHAYLLTPGSNTLLTAIPAGSSTYYCGGKATGSVALDAYSNGCPGLLVGAATRAVAIDPNGNLFYVQSSGGQYNGIRVLYSGGAAVANVITTYFQANCAKWAVTGSQSTTITTANICSQTFTPQPGHVYALSQPFDFITLRGLAVSTDPVSGAISLYASDNGALANETGLQAATAGNQIKQFTGTGWATFIAGSTSAGPTSPDGDGGLAKSATVSGPSHITADSNGNLYIVDGGNARIRVVYAGGKTPPLYVEGSNATVVTNPQVGYVYTVVGGGTSKTSPSLASALSTGAAQAFGVDGAGDLYFTDKYNLTWIVPQATGMAVNIAGGATSVTSGSVSLAPSPGVACNASSPANGPLMTDAYADGCPATEVSPLVPTGVIVFDSAGNFYEVESRVTSGATGILREYSYPNRFGSVQVGSTSSSLLAFTPYTRANSYTPASGYSLTGVGTSEFSDGGTKLCSTSTGSYAVQTCTFEVAFSPSLAGERLGGMTLSSSGTVLASVPVSGNGVAAQLSLDPATASVIGSGHNPSGVTADQAGNVYFSDLATGSVYRSAGGGAPVAYLTGLNGPGQIAVSGTGNLFVADTGNNRIAYLPAGASAGSASTFLKSASGLSFSQPIGIGVDGSGDIYVADSGNNRVVEIPYDNGSYATSVTVGFTGLNGPEGLAIDSSGDVFVADTGNSRVLELTPAGVQSTVSVSPSLSKPVGVSVDPAGDLFIADAGLGKVLLLPSGSSSATVTEPVSGINSVAVDPLGDVYATASSAGGVLVFNRSAVTIQFPQTNIGNISNETFSLSNSGNATLNYGASLYTATDTTDYSVVPATTNGCSTSVALVPGAGCSLSGEYQPQYVAAAISDTVTFPASNAVNPATVVLTGPSQLGLAYTFGSPGTSPNTINVTFTATLAVSPPTTPINGTVTFTIGTIVQTVPVANGGASVTVALAAGTYNVSATYQGSTYPGSVTASTSLVVVAGTSSIALSIKSPSGTITYGQSAVIDAVVTNGNSPVSPTGTITFTVNNVAQTPVAFAPSVLDTLLLPSGTYTVVASYSGDTNYVPAHTSLTLVVGRATPSLSLTASPVVGALSNSILLTAKLAAAPTLPTGNVSFSYGSTSLGSPANVNQGAATQATATNALSSYTFTANYSGDANFLPATVTVTAMPQLVLAINPTSLTMLQNSNAQVMLTLNSFFGYAASRITFSCSGTPTYTACDATPSISSASADQVTSLPLQFFTNAPPQVAVEQGDFMRRSLTTAIAALFIVTLPLARRRSMPRLLVVLIVSCVLFSAVACQTSTSSTMQYITPTGTYTVTVTATDGTVKASAPVSLTVDPGPSAGRPN